MTRTNSKYSGLIAIIILFPIILLALFAWGLYRLVKATTSKKRSVCLQNIEDMSPYEFEHYIGRLFQKMGYKTKTTKASHDFGVDVIARNKDEVIAIQVKKYKDHPVGNKEVQMLLGAMQMRKIQANKSIIITTSRFTKNAFGQANGCPIELWDGKKLNKVIKKYN